MSADAAAPTLALGVVGLGRMGAGIRDRLRRAGHTVTGYDTRSEISDVPSLQAMAEALPRPRVAWLMVPAGEATEAAVHDVAALFSPGDVVVDGGNSWYRDSLRRGRELAQRGIRFLDVGTSGGVWGLEEGFCLMAGGPREAFDHLEPVLASLAPPGGYAYLGTSGAGHFAKMVHNGIEYGMLQAYAEGFDLLQAATEYDYDLHQIAALWNNGSVVRSWLLKLAEAALEKDPRLDRLAGYVQDSGEGRWTVAEGVERGVNVQVLAQALFARFTSRDEKAFAMRLIAALRNEFGGHPVRPA